MAVHIDWGDYDQTVILMHISGNWTGEEFYAAMNDFIDKANHANGAIELMVDLRQSLRPPKNIVTMIRSILRLDLPQNIHQVVVISQTSFWERIYATIRQVVGTHIAIPVSFVNSVDAGYNLLNAFSDTQVDIAQS